MRTGRYTVARFRDAERIADGGPAVGGMFNSDGLAVVPQTGNLLIADDFTWPRSSSTSGKTGR